MTLKVRLAAMMIVLLIAVMALQFILAQREQRELADRLDRLSSEVNSSTRDVSLRALALAAEGENRVVDRLITEIQGDSTAGKAPGRASVQVLRQSRAACPPDDRSLTRRRVLIGDDGSQIVETEIWVVADSTAHPAGGAGSRPGLSWVYAESLAVAAAFAGDSIRIDAHLDAGSPDDFVFHFPLPIVEPDTLHFVEVRYPATELKSALVASRRRSLLWMASLLGVGVLGAAAIAVQFTRPIRSLEQSFQRVESGDLDVAVEPRRRDEMGRLTRSFNRMVGRLKESRHLEARLIETEHLASLGRLAAGVAHEVRNPLNAIQLTMQQMRDKAAPTADDGERRRNFERYHETVTREVQRLEGLVGAFLDLSRSEALAIELMDVGETLIGSAELFRPDAERRDVRLELDASGPLRIEGDPSRLSTVWNNLLSNAIASTPPGGRVTVRAVGSGPPESGVRVTVSDTGPGIPAETLSRIWEPFYSTRPGGTGLGLSIVRSVVERHGGRVEASSTAGAGTIIAVWLPALSPTRPMAAPA